MFSTTEKGYPLISEHPVCRFYTGARGCRSTSGSNGQGRKSQGPALMACHVVRNDVEVWKNRENHRRGKLGFSKTKGD